MESNEIEKNIIDCIKREKFSKLTFLEKEWKNTDQKFYIGFFYFVLDLKNENNEHVFNEIVKREGTKAKAFIFLGKIANKIYNTRARSSASISLFIKALREDDSSSEAHWLVYNHTYCLDNLLQTLKIDTKNNDMEMINLKLNNIRRLDDFQKSSKADLNFLKNLLTRSEVIKNDKIRGILCRIHFLLSEYDQGLYYIGISNKIDVNTIKDYYDKNLISLNQAISKIHDFQLEKFVKGNEEEIYNILLDKSKNNVQEISKNLLIKRAYLANKFNDVVEEFNLLADKSGRSNNPEINLYYLLSQQALKIPLNKEILKNISSKFGSEIEFYQTDNLKFLYYNLLFNIYIEEIKNEISCDNPFNLGLESFLSYKKAESILQYPEILKSKNYELFRDKLEELKLKVLKINKLNRFNDYEINFDLKCIESDSLIDYCSLCIEFKEIEKAIQLIEKYHESNLPTMSTYNTLAVCYQRNGKYKEALEGFKKAYEAMKSSKENDYMIVQNYLDCSKYVKGFKFTDKEYEQLSEELNIGLINCFKWSDFYTDRYNTLYKYSPFNINTIDALSNQYFFLPSKSQLNDPIELPDLNKIKPETHILNKYYICSFSNNENSMLMWSHYAQQHQGIMVEYFFSGELPYGFGIGKVSYAEDVKRLKDKDLYIFNQFLLTKNKDWSYENEVRLFTTLRNKVEFDKYDYPNPDRSKINASVRSITLGLNFPDDKKRLLRNLISLLNNKRSSYEPEIIVKQAFLSETNSYSLVYKEIHLD